MQKYIHKYGLKAKMLKNNKTFQNVIVPMYLKKMIK